MAVLINMEMTQACFDCRFINEYVPGIYTCVIAAKSTKIINQRPKWCPLMDSDAVKAKLADGLAEAAYKAFQTKYDKCVDAKDFPIGEPPTFDHIGLFRFMNEQGVAHPKGLTYEQSTNLTDAGMERG